MYILREFLEMAMSNLKQEWQSPEHRSLAERVCLCNPAIRTMDSLMDTCSHINGLTPDQVQEARKAKAVLESLGMHYA